MKGHSRKSGRSAGVYFCISLKINRSSATRSLRPISGRQVEHPKGALNHCAVSHTGPCATSHDRIGCERRPGVREPGTPGLSTEDLRPQTCSISRAVDVPSAQSHSRVSLRRVQDLGKCRRKSLTLPEHGCENSASTLEYARIVFVVSFMKE